jgi:hypothetical protein
MLPVLQAAQAGRPKFAAALPLNRASGCERDTYGIQKACSAILEINQKSLPANGHTGFLNVDTVGLDHDMAGMHSDCIFDARSPSSPY